VNYPDQIQMSRHEVLAMIAIEPILRRLGLSLYCLRCHARGEKDGIKAGNDITASTLTIECGCATRIYQRDGSQPQPKGIG